MLIVPAQVLAEGTVLRLELLERAVDVSHILPHIARIEGSVVTAQLSCRRGLL